MRSEASFLPSLAYFHPQFMTLASPHRIWSTAGSNTYEVAKARVQLLFLSSQYPCAKLTRHWSKDNPLGLCSFPACKEKHRGVSRAHLVTVSCVFSHQKPSHCSLPKEEGSILSPADLKLLTFSLNPENYSIPLGQLSHSRSNPFSPTIWRAHLQ